MAHIVICDMFTENKYVGIVLGSSWVALGQAQIPDRLKL